MIAKRLAMVYLIDKNIPTHSISKLIKVSPSTVARFEVRFERNQLSKTSEWVRDKTVTNKLLKLGLVAIGLAVKEEQGKRVGIIYNKGVNYGWIT